MRPVLVVQNAVGFSDWVGVDYIAIAFGIGLGLSFSEDANFTAGVQHTFDDITPPGSHLVKISQTGTTVTVTDYGDPLQRHHPSPGHGLITNDSVIITGSDQPGMDGTFAVTVTDQHTYTYTSGTSQTAVSNSAKANDIRVFNHSTLTGLSGTPPTRQDGYYAYPVRAIRLILSSYTAGMALLNILEGHGAP